MPQLSFEADSLLHKEFFSLSCQTESPVSLEEDNAWLVELANSLASLEAEWNTLG